jgi:hypothetical protein
MFSFGFRLTLAHLCEIGGNPEAFAHGRSNLIVFAKLEPIFFGGYPKVGEGCGQAGRPKTTLEGIILSSKRLHESPIRKRTLAKDHQLLK